MNKQLSLIIIMLHIVIAGTCQFSQSENAFALSLFHKKKYDRALHVFEELNQINNSCSNTYYKNCCHLYLKNFNLIADSCCIFDSIFSKKNATLVYGANCFNSIEQPSFDYRLNTNYTTLFNSVYFLKNRQINNFQCVSYNATNKELISIHQKMAELSYNYSRINKKKPIIAASMSAVIPGLGKVYAGRPTEIIQPLLKCIVSGLVAYEGYKKNEFSSVSFYIFGTYGIFNYLSSIVGSYYTVKSRKNDEEKWMDNELENYYYSISKHIIEH